MTTNQKKIIWTLTAIAVSGLAAYSIFIHQPENSNKFNPCFFCSIRNSSGIVGFVVGICITCAVYAYTKE